MCWSYRLAVNSWTTVDTYVAHRALKIRSLQSVPIACALPEVREHCRIAGGLRGGHASVTVEADSQQPAFVTGSIREPQPDVALDIEPVTELPVGNHVRVHRADVLEPLTLCLARGQLQR